MSVNREMIVVCLYDNEIIDAQVCNTRVQCYQFIMNTLLWHHNASSFDKIEVAYPTRPISWSADEEERDAISAAWEITRRGFTYNPKVRYYIKETPAPETVCTFVQGASKEYGKAKGLAYHVADIIKAAGIQVDVKPIYPSGQQQAPNEFEVHIVSTEEECRRARRIAFDFTYPRVSDNYQSCWSRVFVKDWSDDPIRELPA